jgi:hypothetical protein
MMFAERKSGNQTLTYTQLKNFPFYARTRKRKRKGKSAKIENRDVGGNVGGRCFILHSEPERGEKQPALYGAINFFYQFLKHFAGTKFGNNVLTCGLSGKVGELPVFGRRFGQTLVSKITKPSSKVSEKLPAQRIRFQQTAGKAAIASPETAALCKAAATGGKNYMRIYTATRENGGMATSKITIAAFDLPPSGGVT